jgi:hypothetical protein
MAPLPSRLPEESREFLLLRGLRANACSRSPAAARRASESIKLIHVDGFSGK